MIPDLITPLSKQTKTRQSLVAFLNNLIEEGVAKISTYAISWNRDVNANVITAVTDEAYRDGRHNWAKMGFLSRFIVFSYSYHESTITEILGTYSKKGITLKPIKMKIPRRHVAITLSKGIADQLDPTARRIGQSFNLYGFRAKINFRSLLKAIAYRNSRREVTVDDLQEFLQLADYMNLQFNPL
jgi:hypothetical protein